MKQVLKWYISCNRLWIHFCWENLLLLFDNICSYILVPNSWGLSWRGNLQCRAMNSTIEWWKVPKFEERWCCDCYSAPFDWWQLSIKEWGRRRQGAHILWLRKGGAPQPEGQEEKAGAGRGVGGLVGSWRVRRKPEVHRGSPAPLSHHCLRPFLGKLNIIPSNSLADRTNQLSKTTPL